MLTLYVVTHLVLLTGLALLTQISYRVAKPVR
jgi:hypothetical protein